MSPTDSAFSRIYTGEQLDRIAFPLGGIGAGMICIEGTGYFSHQSLHHRPEVAREMVMFGAICVKGTDGNTARVLEGRVPSWRRFNFEARPGGLHSTAGNGSRATYGLPRYHNAEFLARVPFCEVMLSDQHVPLQCTIKAWSPFVPNDADASSLPVAAIEYTFRNPSQEPQDAVFSFHAANPMVSGGDEGWSHQVGLIPDGVCFSQTVTDGRPGTEGHFSISAPAENEKSLNPAWFRGGWFDPLTLVWKAISEGQAIDSSPYTEGGPSPGGSLYVPFTMEPREYRTIVVNLAWYVPHSNLRVGYQNEPCAEGQSCCDNGHGQTAPPAYQPWYAGRFDSVEALAEYWNANYASLREQSDRFAQTLASADLPEEVVNAVSANLTILKSPTVLRQIDGRFWGWEGCCDASGCCSGSCTHVWNYAQALCHLFPELERTLRNTELNEGQNDEGHQAFRVDLPIRKMADDKHGGHAASDGQLGGIMKVYREWRISGDTEWLTGIWPRVKASLEYCIRTWDPDEEGVLREPHHNTYDIEFWGPDGMCTSFYLGALKAAGLIATELGEDGSRYDALYRKGRAFMEDELWNGEYFIQKIQWEGLRADNPAEVRPFIGSAYSPEAIELLKKEGPKYQYGEGCLSDGVLGAWLAAVCGVGEILDPEKVRSHLLAIHRYNLKTDLSEHVNPQRPTYAFGDEGGLLLCSWPRGGELTLPFVYSNEVWTGIEYQVASHLMLMGCVSEGLEIVRTCRARYDGRKRNPFNEYECGHWYARAMASYGLLQGLSGARYDAVTKTLHLTPSLQGDFSSFLCTATGYGLVGVRDGEPFVDVRSGVIEVAEIDYCPAAGR